MALISLGCCCVSGGGEDCKAKAYREVLTDQKRWDWSTCLQTNV